MQKPLFCIQDITTLFVVIDDSAAAVRRTGRPSLLSDSELLTILIWCTVMLRQRQLKDIYRFVGQYHRKDFPRMPSYKNFVIHAHRLIPLMTQLLQNSFAFDSPLQFADSTMVQVCRLVRANHHKVARRVADFGKNHQGWHYGFKLHASVDPKGQFCGLVLTPANVHDAQLRPYLIRGRVKVIVGDSAYGARVMRERMWKERGTLVLAPPHFSQKKKLMTGWQCRLLRARPKIESVFDYLKNHLGLVTSFARSVTGYLFHYLRILLAYQFMVTLLRVS
jgi:hypothetical protein